MIAGPPGEAAPEDPSEVALRGRCSGFSVTLPVISVATCAEFYSRSHGVVIRVYDDAGNVIEAREHAGGFKDCQAAGCSLAPAGAIAELFFLA